MVKSGAMTQHYGKNETLVLCFLSNGKSHELFRMLIRILDTSLTSNLTNIFKHKIQEDDLVR